MPGSFNSTLEDNPLFNMFGGHNIPIVTAEEANLARDTYFQAVLLHRNGWCPIKEEGQPLRYVQIREFNLIELNPCCELVVDLLVREDEEEERKYYDDHLVGMEVRENQIIFFSDIQMPIHMALGLKQVSTYDHKTVVLPPPEKIRKKKDEY